MKLRRVASRCVGTIAPVVLAACVTTAPGPGEITDAPPPWRGRVAVDDHTTRRTLEVPVTVYRAAPGAPTVLYVHGCSGVVAAHRDAWTRALVAWGYHVVVPEILAARGLGDNCDPRTNRIGRFQWLQDVVQVGQWASAQPWHGGRLGLVGFSQGGLAVLDAAAEPEGLPRHRTDRVAPVRFSAGVAVYPYCSLDHAVREPGFPVQLQVGMADQWTRPEACMQLDRSRPGAFEMHFHAGATHGFDVPGAYLTNRWGYRIEYSGDATRAAMSQARRFLDQHLRN